MDIKIFAEDVEELAERQLARIAAFDAFKDAKIRIMPDVHVGKGCVCGFTANLGEKVVPNLIGVDIGCGMLTVELGDIEIDFAKLDSVIRTHVPSGMNVRETVRYADGYGAWQCDPRTCIAEFPDERLGYFDRSVGTLGGGNHFIEIDTGRDGCKYLVVHCGSRNFGKRVCEVWQDVAVRRLVESVPSLPSLIAETKAQCEDVRNLPAAIKQTKVRHAAMLAQVRKERADLEWLEGEDRAGYIHDMKIAQRWALLNRQTIADMICREMGWSPRNQFSTVHNYLGEDNIIRKSAISAKKDERVLIPLNMRDGSIIAVGKGNADWNESAPHGAGRLMSRSVARKQISLDDYRQSMEGIWTSCVNEDTVDESAFAYKPAETIIRQIAETVDVVEVIKPLYNFKAAE